MPFLSELDDRRQEVRRGASGTVTLWPKVDGANVAVTAPTAISYGPSGNQLAAPSVTNTSLSSVSRLTVSIDATSLELGENHRVDFTYTYSAASYVESIAFDVVVEPWGTIGGSLNDLVDEQADIGPMVLRQAQNQLSSRTVEEQAQVLLVHAARSIRSRVKSKVEADRGVGSWPIFIINKDEVRPVIIAEAVRRAIASQGLLSDALVQLEAYWARQVELRFAGMPALQYSADEDRVADSVLNASVVRSERSW